MGERQGESGRNGHSAARAAVHRVRCDRSGMGVAGPVRVVLEAGFEDHPGYPLVTTATVLRWPGSKWRLAPLINSYLPATRVYVEPFCGGASVLLQRPRSEIEVLNDINGDVVTFWRCLRDDARRLAYLVDNTPYSREEYEASRQREGFDEFETARRLVVRCWQGFGSKIVGASGWRRSVEAGKRNPQIDWWSLPDRLRMVADRLRGVYIERLDALTLLRQFWREDTALYVDPPYHPETIPDSRFYPDAPDVEFHRELVAQLHRFPGPVVLSGYEHADYDSVLSDWMRSSVSALADGGHHRTECLWVNPVAMSMQAQTSLFDLETV